MVVKRNQKKNLKSENIPEASVPPPAQDQSSGMSWYGKHTFIITTGLFVLVLLVVAGLLFQNYTIAKRQRQAQQQLAAAEQQLKSSEQTKTSAGDDQQLLAAVGQLIVLPTDEQPTIATVQDLSKLQGQPFFANAEIGDKVLIYSTAKKAILYRPSTNQIIELAPLNTDSGSSTASSTSQTLSVEIRNGTGKSGQAGEFKTMLAGQVGFSVVKVGNAKTTYPKTEIFIANPNASLTLVSNLQQLSNGDIITTLPAGEGKTSADVLLILGTQ